MKKALLLLLVFAMLLPCFAVAGYAEEAESSAPKAQALQDNLVVTEHSAMIQGQSIPYTATTGTMALSSDLGQYEIFFTAYTRSDVEDPGSRPITFAFNGGPGSSSIWLHIGFLAPRRIDLDPMGNAEQLPAKVIDNDISILDMTDLVFIDPVGTGYSRVLEGTDFHGFIVSKITADTVLLRQGDITLEWKP